jgi:REP-associated tyrosine transposase
VDVVLEQILRSATDTGFAVVAYCFMPDHVHLLVEAQSEASDCRQFIKRAKQFSGYYFKQKFGVRLWQRYGFEHVLRDDEPTLGVARYTLENPVRGGLVQRVEDYPFAGSAVYPLAEILAAVQMMPANRQVRLKSTVRLKPDTTYVHGPAEAGHYVRRNLCALCGLSVHRRDQRALML